MWFLMLAGAVLLIDRGRTTKYAAGLFFLIGLSLAGTWPGETIRDLIMALE